MSLVTTSAIVLHTFPYGETSKIVRLATPDHGVVSAIAKGAQRSKSRFDLRLQPMSEGTVRLYMKPNRELHTLAEFELSRQRGELARHFQRYSAAAAVAEVVLRVTSQEARPEIYHVLQMALDALMGAEDDEIGVVSLAAMWSVVRVLGFGPSLTVCAVDGRPLESGGARFSVVEGGFLCGACSRSRHSAALDQADRHALEAFVEGAVPPSELPVCHAAAHRRLVVRFIRQHVAEDRELPALTFWEKGR